MFVTVASRSGQSTSSGQPSTTIRSTNTRSTSSANWSLWTYNSTAAITPHSNGMFTDSVIAVINDTGKAIYCQHFVKLMLQKNSHAASGMSETFMESKRNAHDSYSVLDTMVHESFHYGYINS